MGAYWCKRAQVLYSSTIVLYSIYLTLVLLSFSFDKKNPESVRGFQATFEAVHQQHLLIRVGITGETTMPLHSYSLAARRILCIKLSRENAVKGGRGSKKRQSPFGNTYCVCVGILFIFLGYFLHAGYVADPASQATIGTVRCSHHSPVYAFGFLSRVGLSPPFCTAVYLYPRQLSTHRSAHLSGGGGDN